MVLPQPPLLVYITGWGSIRHSDGTPPAPQQVFSSPDIMSVQQACFFCPKKPASPAHTTHIEGWRVPSWKREGRQGLAWWQKKVLEPPLFP